jgi:hypothetical protein
LGSSEFVKIRKVFQRRIDHHGDGISVAGSINAAIVANVNEPGENRVRVRNHQRLVQIDGQTVVHESHSDVDDDAHR